METIVCYESYKQERSKTTLAKHFDRLEMQNESYNDCVEDSLDRISGIGFSFDVSHVLTAPLSILERQ